MTGTVHKKTKRDQGLPRGRNDNDLAPSRQRPVPQNINQKGDKKLVSKDETARHKMGGYIEYEEKTEHTNIPWSIGGTEASLDGGKRMADGLLMKLMR